MKLHASTRATRVFYTGDDHWMELMVMMMMSDDDIVMIW